MVITGGGDHQCCYREQLAFNLYSKFCEPKLYRLANTKSSDHWDLIPARCKSHPKEAAFRHKYAPNDTALHRILRVADQGKFLQDDAEEESMQEVEEGAGESSHNKKDTIASMKKLNAIQAILKANPQAAMTQDAFGRTPIHLNCMDLCSPADTVILELLVRASSNGGKSSSSSCLLLRDVEKRTPLHYLLARSNNIIPMDALQVLLETCPEAALLQDVVKETPMDIVTRRGRDGEIENVAQVLEMLSANSAAPKKIAQGQQRAVSDGTRRVS